MERRFQAEEQPWGTGELGHCGITKPRVQGRMWGAARLVGKAWRVMRDLEYVAVEP